MDVEVEMPDLAEVLKSALSLKANDRAVVAEKLLASLDDLDEEEASRLWAEEATRRLQEFQSGSAVTVTAHEVARKVEKLLR
jgi:hypothetical protein